MKKMTYVDALNVVIATMEDGEVKEKIVALKTSLENRNKSKKTDEKVLADYQQILDLLADGKKRTATEISKEIEAFADYTFNKVNSRIRELRKSNQIVRTEEKGKAYFALPDAE